MFKKVLMSTDGSGLSVAAAPRAVELARLSGGTLHVVYVQEPYPYSGIGSAVPAGLHEHLARGHRLAAAAFERVRDIARGQGVAVETAVLEGAAPAPAIVNAASDLGADAIVIASHGRTGAARLLLGSVAAEVLALAAIPVLVVKQEGPGHDP